MPGLPFFLRRVSRGRETRLLAAVAAVLLALPLALNPVFSGNGFLGGASFFTGQQEAREKPQGPPASTLRIAFVGDVLLESPWRQPPTPPRELFADVREVLSAADVAVCNLESPLTAWAHHTRHKNPRSVAAGRDFILRTTSPDAAPALRDAGIDVAALANNHTMDYTERGLLETLERLEAAGILGVGGGENLAAAEQPRVIEARDWRVGFLSFSDVVPPYFWAEEHRPGIASSKDTGRLREAIAKARRSRSIDFLVVIFHWGEERARRPSRRQQELARVAERAGADLVLGAHPHVLQGVGCVGRTPVIYSAGNFVFPTSRAAAQRTAIFEVSVQRPTESSDVGQGFGSAGRERQARPTKSSRSISVRILPAILNEEGKVSLAGPALARDILREMGKVSAGLGARLDGDTATCSGAAEKAAARRKRGSR